MNGYNGRMNPDDVRAEEPIRLTQGEWQELLSSLQNLMLANASLLQTVSELMAQRQDAWRDNSSSPPPLSDPYDLRLLNSLTDSDR